MLPWEAVTTAGSLQRPVEPSSPCLLQHLHPSLPLLLLPSQSKTVWTSSLQHTHPGGWAYSQILILVKDSVSMYRYEGLGLGHIQVAHCPAHSMSCSLWKQLLIPHNPPHTTGRTFIFKARSPLRLDKLHNLTQLSYNHPSLFKGVSTPRKSICQLRDYALPHPTDG